MGANLVSLITGIIFGASLVLAGLANPDRITRALRLKDLYIIRTVIVFLLIGLVGTWIIEMLGTVEMENKSAAIVTMIVGGLLVGAGMGLTGYTPGTCLAGAASGRIDAVITILGMFFGAYVYVFLYPPVIRPLETVYNYGKVTLPEISGISAAVCVITVFAAGVFVLILTWAIGVHKTAPAIKSKESIINKEFSNDQIPKQIAEEDFISTKIDSIDSVQLFASLKNLLFLIMIICLVLLQVSFWLVNRGYIVQGTLYGDSISENVTALPFDITFEHITTVINISNTILMLSAVLYALMVFFCFSVSLGAFLGGLRYISRAFFSSLAALILLFPWQIFFDTTLFGAIYTPSELAESNSINTDQTFSVVLLYLRFVAFWAFVTLLLIRSQIYSQRWKKSLLYRIEDII